MENISTSVLYCVLPFEINIKLNPCMSQSLFAHCSNHIRENKRRQTCVKYTYGQADSMRDQQLEIHCEITNTCMNRLHERCITF